MADLSRIKFKRSSVAGKRPLPADIAEGELAINLKDRMLFTKDDQNLIIDLGFANGGNVDGDIVHKGKYTQTGDYVQTGNLTTSGDINSKTITTSSDIVCNGAATFNQQVLPKADITIQNDTKIIWSRNSDYASISFKNTSDDDTDSYMKFVAGDNGNECFKFFSAGSGGGETLWATVNSGQVIPANYGNFDTRYQNIFNLGANRNLNSVTEVGEYAQHSDANTSTALNYPETLAGHLTVSAGAGIQQRYHVYNSSRIWTRAQHYTGAWTPWLRQLDTDFIETRTTQIKTSVADGIKLWNGQYGMILRRSEDNFYLIPTAAGQAENGGIGSLRPFIINCANGDVQMSHNVYVGGTLSAGSVVSAPTLRGNSIQKTDGTAFIAADGNIYLVGATHGFSAGWLFQQLNSRFDTAQTAATNAQTAANNAQSTANTANATANAAARWVNWGTSYNFGILNQTPNQRIIDKGWFLVGLAAAGQNNNTINLIGGRIQVWNNNSGWVDSAT
ncbi:phage tail fiber-like protein [Yersinia phage phiR1-RT]|uniref:Phage tail fiber-like protein n=1 Tax=Yersinia phage phiR1-RT TaxID=1206558 RepID=I7LHB5_BPPR1|nr:long tail fiber protein distal subunit [Yersinia phage phiR1-RT]CCI88824.1 phage tail fiber-like protein [Yersinia phage phiR1-RT]